MMFESVLVMFEDGLGGGIHVITVSQGGGDITERIYHKDVFD